MKQRKICPKCGSGHILRVEDAMGDRGIPLILGFFSAVPVTRCVCTECGYVESWVDEMHLEELKKRYRKEQDR